MNSTKTKTKRPSLSNLKDEVNFFLKKFRNSVALLERYKEPDQKTKLKIHENNLFINAIEKLLSAYEGEVNKLNDLGKIPPQAVELEEAVIGAMILEKSEQTEKVFSFLREDHFYSATYQAIYASLLKMREEKIGIDLRTVVHHLRQSGKLEIVGGAYEMGNITSKVSSAANIEYHARVIIEMATKRKMIEYASRIHLEAYEDTCDIFKLLEWAQKEVIEIEQNNLTK